MFMQIKRTVLLNMRILSLLLYLEVYYPMFVLLVKLDVPTKKIAIKLKAPNEKIFNSRQLIIFKSTQSHLRQVCNIPPCIVKVYFMYEFDLPTCTRCLIITLL